MNEAPRPPPAQYLDELRLDGGRDEEMAEGGHERGDGGEGAGGGSMISFHPEVCLSHDGSYDSTGGRGRFELFGDGDGDGDGERGEGTGVEEGMGLSPMRRRASA